MKLEQAERIRYKMITRYGGKSIFDIKSVCERVQRQIDDYCCGSLLSSGSRDRENALFVQRGVLDWLLNVE